jgi:hypothetical protein
MKWMTREILSSKFDFPTILSVSICSSNLGWAKAGGFAILRFAKRTPPPGTAFKIFKIQFIAIYETTPKNSGMRSGRFLEPSRIAKPASDRNNPEYYAIPDFCIGAELTGRIHFLPENNIF